MRPGERQVAPTIEGIRRDHVARYEWAAKQLPPGSQVIDLACGVGYGAHILAQAGHYVLAIDKDAEAIAYGVAHYDHPRIDWLEKDARGFEPKLGAQYHAAICFETIEHLEDPLTFLRSLRGVPLLIASVPNEDVLPFGNGVLYHFRHYRPHEFEHLLARADWRVTRRLTQQGPHSEVAEGEVAGRTLIAVAEAVELPIEWGLSYGAPVALQTSPAPEKPVPDHVAIVGLGPSCAMFFELTRRMGGVSAWCDEVWGVNAIGDVLRCDRVFHMDDVRIQAIRAAAKPDGNIAAMLKWLKTHPGPVYTSVVRDGYPGLVAFPLEAVLNRKHDSNGGAPYFNSTTAYAIAYAIHIGVKRISVFGADYTMPNAHHGEKGRACCEFWLGIAAARGIEITIPDTSSLMDACETPGSRLYGYDCVDVRLLDQPDGTVKVVMTEREKLPTAAEIEARYDHNKHPNALVRKGDRQ